jgi:hypothetical protein
MAAFPSSTLLFFLFPFLFSSPNVNLHLRPFSFFHLSLFRDVPFSQFFSLTILHCFCFSLFEFSVFFFSPPFTFSLYHFATFPPIPLFALSPFLPFPPVPFAPISILIGRHSPRVPFFSFVRQIAICLSGISRMKKWRTIIWGV